MKRINFYSVKQVKESSGLYELPVKAVNNPADLHKVIVTVLDLENEASEKFGIVTLNSKNMVAGIHILGMGSINACVVHPREVFKAAVLNNAASFCMFHNHPSGDPTPSEEDAQITNRIAELGVMMGIEALDHLVIGHEGRFVSMKEHGMM